MRTIVDLFHATVARAPERVAIRDDDRAVTYAELQGLVHRIANCLIRRFAVIADTPVAIMLGRSERMLASMLGILEAGAAYVPIDLDLPDARIAFLLADVAAPVIVTDAANAERARRVGRVPVLVLGEDERAETMSPPSIRIESGHLAYVIYTSGTSGKPNGVLVEHGSVVNYIVNVREHLGLTPDDVCDFSTSISFDLTVTTTLGCLVLGGCVAIYRGSLHNLVEYQAHLRSAQVSFLKLTPRYFALVAEGLATTSVRTVVLGGEKVAREDLARLSATVQVFDEYGPTEATVGATFSRIYPPPAETDIGICYDGCNAVVLDEHLQPVADGEAGELFLGGTCLARGYLARPELTAARFVHLDERRYRTGDLVRRRNGRFEYIGRNDEQLSVNGYRIEPAEIESVLRTHGDVVQAAVVVDTGRLVAYIVSGEFGCFTDDLRELADAVLPQHLRPSSYIQISALPLTLNGKLDRAALPRPTAVPSARMTPRTELERQLYEIWRGLLAGEFGVDDELLSLGGDSIIAIQIVSRVRQNLGVKLTIAEVFSHNTVAKLALRIGSLAEGADEPRVVGSGRHLPIQTWFFTRRYPFPGHYNQAFVLRTPDLDVERLRAAVDALARRHRALNLRFRGDLQSYASGTIPFHIVHAEELTDHYTRWQREFDLEHGPVCCVGYVHGFADGTARVHIAAHHLVIDTVSWRILSQDLQALYAGERLAPVGADYLQWIDAVLDDPTDESWSRPDQEWPRARARVVERFRLATTTTANLLRHCHAAYSTQVNDVLLAALAIVLRDLTGRDENSIVLEGHGREDLGLDVSRTVGWFTTWFPVRLRAHDDVIATLIDVKETLRAIPRKGIGFGPRFGYDDLPPVFFNYLGQLDVDQRSWQLVGDDPGEVIHPANVDDHGLVVTARVLDGQLDVEVISGFGPNLAAALRLALDAMLVQLVRSDRRLLTPSDVNGVISRRLLDELQRDRDIEAIYRASSLQRGMIHHAATIGDDAYHVQMRWRCDEMDVERLERSWRLAQKTFSALRLRFDWREEAIQIIDRRQPFEWRVIHGVDVAEIERQDRARRYDLTAGSLFRVYVIKREADSCVMFSHHHAILDGWAISRLLQFVATAATSVADTYRDAQTYLHRHYADDAAFWRERLSRYEDRLTLRFGERLLEHRFVIAGAELERLKAVARDIGVTPNALLLYAWHKSLHVVSSSRQTCVGVVVSGRTLPIDGMDAAVGLLINTLPSLATHDDDDEIASAALALQRELHELNEHCAVDLGTLGARLIENLYIYENWPKPPVEIESVVERLDAPLAIVASETQGSIDIRLSGRFEFLTELARLLRQLLAQLEMSRWSDMALVNRPVAPSASGPRSDEVFHERFAKQAERSPDAVAVRFLDEALTYRALDERSTRLAEYLLARGLLPEEPVAVCLDRGLELLVAIIAVMKAGGAYVPLDPSQPAERIEHVLRDCGARIVLGCDPLSGATSACRPAATGGRNLAYVLYTSGTTGRAKGVMVEHGSFCSLIDAVHARFFSGSVSTVSLTNHVFDIFGLEYGLPLLTGGTIELVAELPDTLSCRGLQFVQMTPSLLALMLERLRDTESTLILCGGEALSAELLTRTLSYAPAVVNVYGPTETTIWSTARLYQRSAVTVGLGTPFAGEQVHVLDRYFRPLPQGAIGELHIGGHGLARGYFGQPELTRERFVDTSWGRLYRTGDLVRLDGQGELEFIGRNDFQVKLHGHRIELGEIESAIAACDGVKQCVAVVREATIAAYYVAERDLDLLDQLNRVLPDYMLPGFLIRLPAMPLTATGKLDRSALPPPSASFTSPRNALEAEIRAAWSQVLGVREDDVGIDDDFFALGGDSLRAVRLASRFGRGANLHQARTIRRFAEAMRSSTAIPSTSTRRVLSFAQERIWFVESMARGSAAYHVPLLLELRSDVDPRHLAECLRQIVERHEPLRTVFRTDVDGNLFPVVEASPEAVLRDATDAGDVVRRPFELEREHPFRVRLIGGRELCIVVHHIAFDGWSIDVLLRDLSALLEGRPLPTLPISYRDYAAWERTHLDEADHLRFWRAHLFGAVTLRLPIDFRRPELPDYRGANHRFQIDARAVRKFASGLRVSVSSVLLSAYYLALRCFCHQDDIVVGMPMANRAHPQLDQLIGVFVNTLPLRCTIDPDARVIDLVRQIADSCAEALAHQQLPFEKLVDATTRDPSRHPIYQVLFDIQRFGASYRDAGGVVRVAGKGWDLNTVAKHDLSMFIDDMPDGFDVFINYATSLFRHETVVQFAETWARIVEQMPRVSRISQLRLTASPQVAKLVAGATDSICDAFERRVAAGGDRIAVVARDVALTYQELDARANRLAHRLRSLHGQQPVVVSLERSAHLIVAILAVLKSGVAYVPVEPTHPDQRIRFILEDTGSRLTLVDAVNLERFARLGPSLAVDAFDEVDVSANLRIDAGQPAYVIYTSGSTGAPKGVLETHENVIRLFEATNQICPISSDDIWPLFHSYGFDFSVWEIWGALLHGGRLVVPSRDEVRDPERLHDLCRRHDITILNQTPGALASLLPIALERSPLPALRYVFVGGEPWNVEMLGPWLERFGERPKIVHVYGPTETTVFATMQPFVGDASIGAILPNKIAYVVDTELRPVPDGAIGELCIGGAGIALGYLARESLTAAAFLPDPFRAEGRIYRTGDLVRRARDGRLTFIARDDQQVKIQGHRIELGEIEAALASFPGVLQSAATVRRDGPEPYLAAYYVGRVDAERLRRHLAATLPPYCLPAALVAIDQIPLGATGKIDRAALPSPTQDLAELTAPRSDTERDVRRVIAEILGIDEQTISVTADFFGLGGNSLKSIRLVSRLNREHNASITIAGLFESPSVAGLARKLATSSTAEQLIPRFRPEASERQVLSYAQERLWFVDQYERGTSAYNIGLSYRLADGTDSKRLERCLRELARRHEVLRTVIRHGDSGAYQLVLDVELALRDVVVESVFELDAAMAEQLERVFDLANDAPWRATLYKLDDAAYLGLVIHHIAFDGWSVEVLVSELEALYRAEPLREPSIQYRDYAAWDRGRLTGEAVARSVQYWRRHLHGHAPLDLPLDLPRPRTTSYFGAEVGFAFDEELSGALRRLAAELEVSLFAVLLSGYYLMLRAFSHQDNLIVGVPIATRDHAQLEPLIGCFLNTLALDFQVERSESFPALIRRCAARIREAREHAELPFERMVAELGLAVDPSRHPVFQVTFDVNSFVSAPIELNSGLLRFHRPETGSTRTAKFDLSAFVDDSSPCLTGTFTYATSIFTRASVEGFIATYRQTLEQLVGPVKVVGELALVDDRVDQWSIGPVRQRADETVLDRFEMHVAREPDAIAVVFDARSLSFRELDDSSTRLAARLAAIGVTAGDLVMLALERGEGIIVSMLAVWKLRAAWVPVDPEFPDGRLSYLLRDTQARVVICDQPERWTCLGARTLSVFADGPVAPLVTRSAPDDLAYVIYTSGTSGEAKGVMVTHRSLTNLHADQTERYRLHDGEVILQVSNYIFDATVEQLVLALANGFTLLMVPQRLWLDTRAFRDYLLRHRCTHISATPTFLDQFDPGSLPCLRRYVVGGEALEVACVRKLRTSNPTAAIFNQYGPTEITVTCLGHEICDDDVTIGRPMANTKALVLSSDAQPLPPGAIGELYIGGVGVARGYLNKPELTRERFVDTRWGRLYRTGDLVRWRRDGLLHFCGRADQQVKIRGYRIELGEINAVLAALPGVTRSVVVVSARQQLVAYYTSTESLHEEQLVSSLKRALPEYMVPSFLVRVDLIPMTPHGKLDIALLPPPQPARARGVDGPWSLLALRLREVWTEVLGIDTLGLDDDFFEVGGNSILAIRLVTQLQSCGELRVADVFSHRTLRSQTALLGHAVPSGITRLNASTADASMFMIHPAHAGAEVYVPLARRLERRFACFGLDSHNLHSTSKVESLSALAELYLSRIEGVIRPEKYKLLGWSLGGQIALEMAAILETRGARDIEVILIDTVLPDETFGSVQPELELAAYEPRLVGLDEAWRKKVVDNFFVDVSLSRQPISRRLHRTRVKLMKAGRCEPHVKALVFNNVDRIVPVECQLIDAGHFDILDHLDEITAAV